MSMKRLFVVSIVCIAVIIYCGCGSFTSVGTLPNTTSQDNNAVEDANRDVTVGKEEYLKLERTTSYSPYTKKITRQILTEYNENGDIVTKEEIYNQFPNQPANINRSSFDIEYEYGENNRIKKAISYGAVSYGQKPIKSIKEYDDQGNEIREESYGSEGEISRKTDYEYDENGRIISEKYANSAGDFATRKVYEYDQKGNKIKESTYDSDGKCNFYTEFEYDEQNKVVKEKVFRGNDLSIRDHDYGYDDSGEKVTSERIHEYEYKEGFKPTDIDGFFEVTLFSYDDAGREIQKSEHNFYYTPDGRMEGYFQFDNTVTEYEYGIVKKEPADMPNPPDREKVIREYYRYALYLGRSGLIFIDDINNDGILDMLYRRVLNNEKSETLNALKELEDRSISYGMGGEGYIGPTEIYSFDPKEGKVNLAEVFYQSSNFYEVFLVNNDSLWDKSGLYDSGNQRFISYSKDFNVKKELILEYSRDPDSSGFDLLYYIDDQQVSDKYSVNGNMIEDARSGREYVSESPDDFVQSLRCLKCFSNTPKRWVESFPEIKDLTTPAGMGREYTSRELCKLARDYYYSKSGYPSSEVGIDHQEGNTVMIHLFEDMGDHLATHDWYWVDVTTGETTNNTGEKFNLFTDF